MVDCIRVSKNGKCLNPWCRRHLGMIPKQRADSLEDALVIRSKKSSWMVLYLRARRSGDPLIGFFRKQHFGEDR